MENILTNEELVKLYHAGNPSALEALYLQNYGLICQTVRRLCWSKPKTFEDEMQEAYFALVQAVKAYPDSTDIKFSTYIINSIKWHKARRNDRERQRNPNNFITISLDEPLPGIEDGDLTLGSTIADPEAELEFEDRVEQIADQQVQERLKEVLSEIIAGLPRRSREVIRERLKGYSQAEIARLFGISASAVGQYENIAYREFRKRENLEKLKEFLDYYNLGYKNTSFRFWKDTGYSSVEWAIEKKLAFEARWIRKEGGKGENNG